MDHAHIDEYHVAERYLMGQLPAAEAALFEEHYFDCAECLERLELAGRFRHALKGVVVEEAARSASLLWLGPLVRWARRRSWQAVSTLGALVLLVVLSAGHLAHRIDQLETERGQLSAELQRILEPQANAPILRLGSERSDPEEVEPSALLTLDGEPEWIVLWMEPENESPGSYQATLVAPDGGVVWQRDGLERDAFGALRIYLHSSAVAAGVYRLELAASGADGGGAPTATYAFRVRRPGSSLK